APAGPVSALLLRPAQPRFLYVLAHGAGAGMRHPFLATVARALATRGVATLRYQFPYLERRRGRPHPPPVPPPARPPALARGAPSAGAAPVRRWQVDGGAHDVAGGRARGRRARERERPGLSGFSAASAPAARRPAGPASGCGAAADAVLAGDA